MTKSLHNDEQTLEMILEYIRSIMPRAGAIVMLVDPDTQTIRPTTNLHPEDAIDFAEQCLAHMKATQARVNPKTTVQ